MRTLACECVCSFINSRAAVCLRAWLRIISPLEAAKNINYIYPSTSKQWRGTRGRLLGVTAALAAQSDIDILSGEYKGVSVNHSFFSGFRPFNNCSAWHTLVFKSCLWWAGRGVCLAHFAGTRSLIKYLLSASPCALKWAAVYTVGRVCCMCNWLCNNPSACNRAHWILVSGREAFHVSVSQTMCLAARQHDWCCSIDRANSNTHSF